MFLGKDIIDPNAQTHRRQAGYGTKTELQLMTAQIQMSCKPKTKNRLNRGYKVATQKANANYNQKQRSTRGDTGGSRLRVKHR